MPTDGTAQNTDESSMQKQYSNHCARSRDVRARESKSVYVSSVAAKFPGKLDAGWLDGYAVRVESVFMRRRRRLLFAEFSQRSIIFRNVIMQFNDVVVVPLTAKGARAQVVYDYAAGEEFLSNTTVTVAAAQSTRNWGGFGYTYKNQSPNSFSGTQYSGGNFCY